MNIGTRHQLRNKLGLVPGTEFELVPGTDIGIDIHLFASTTHTHGGIQYFFTDSKILWCNL